MHEAAPFLESSLSSDSKKYKRSKNSIFLGQKPKLDFKPDLLAFDHIGKVLPDYDVVSKYSSKARYIVVTTDDPESVLESIPMEHVEIEALAMWGTFEPTVKKLSQLIFYKKKPKKLNMFAYICSSALLELSWLKLLKPKSVGVLNARNMNWHVAAHKAKLPYTIHTEFRLLAKRITSNSFCSLNLPGTIYDFKERFESGEIG